MPRSHKRSEFNTLYRNKEWLEALLEVFASVERAAKSVGVAQSTIYYWKKKFNLPRKKLIITKVTTKYKPPLREKDDMIYNNTKGIELNFLKISEKYNMDYRKIMECYYGIIERFPNLDHRHLMGLIIYFKNTHITKHKISDFLGIDYSSFCRTSKKYYHLIEEEFGNLKFNINFL